MGEVIYINSILKRLNPKKKTVSFRCNPLVLDFLKETATKQDISLSCLVNEILTDFYNEKR